MKPLRFLGITTAKPRKSPDQLAFEYGTHLPVLKAIIDVFQPRGVLELGAGRFSTPLFYHQMKTVVTVESDAKWIEEVAKDVPPRESFHLVHHALPGLTSRTRINSIPERTKAESLRFYNRLLAQHPGLNLLFIDHVSGLRAYTLANLHARFDFVVYHDAEDRGYGYEQFIPTLSTEYFHFLFRSFIPYTGILINKKFADRVSDFNRALDRQSQGYFLEQYRFDLQDRANAEAFAADPRNISA